MITTNHPRSSGEAISDDWKNLYMDLHKVLAPAIDYIQGQNGKFCIPLGEDIVPHIVRLFIAAYKPSPNVDLSDLKWPEGYCRDPNGAICKPEGKYEDFEFGYEVGFREAMGIKMHAVSAHASPAPSVTAEAVAVSERGIRELMAEPFELNMSNYNELDVANLNDWAIRAYDALAQRAGTGGAAEDTTRLDWLDRMNAELNRHYGTKYQWKLILSPNIVRLMTGAHARGFVGALDLNDAQCGEGSHSSVRAAIDEVRSQS